MNAFRLWRQIIRNDHYPEQNGTVVHIQDNDAMTTDMQETDVIELLAHPNIEALNCLYRVAIKAPNSGFKMWRGAMPFPQEAAFIHSCGATLCLAGWAAIDPWFVERGFAPQLDIFRECARFFKRGLRPVSYLKDK